MADLGSGTGILPIIVNQCGEFNGGIYAFDKEPNCVESTKMNC
jgi:ribosomal protein L11 methylase PrmA